MRMIEWLRHLWFRRLSLSGLNADMNDRAFMVQAPERESIPKSTRSSANDFKGYSVLTTVWKRPGGKVSIS